MATDRNTADPVLELDSELVALVAEHPALLGTGWDYDRYSSFTKRENDAIQRFADTPATSIEGVIIKLRRVVQLISEETQYRRNNLEQEQDILLLAIADIERLTAETPPS